MKQLCLIIIGILVCFTGSCQIHKAYYGDPKYFDQKKTLYGKSYSLKQNIEDGYWKFYFSKEDSLKNYYNDTITHPDTIFIEGYYKNGKQQGKHLTYWANGNVAKEENFIDGIPDGIKKEYWLNGQNIFSSNFKNGLEQGDHIGYDVNGKNSYREKFLDGKNIDTSFYYYSNGGIREMIVYEKNSTKSITTSFFETGQTSFIGYYDNQTPYGIWTYWDINGKKTDELIYNEKGNLIKTKKY